MHRRNELIYFFETRVTAAIDGTVNMIYPVVAGDVVSTGTAMATIAETKLEDKDGNKGEITSGMELEARIITQKKQILRYLLEKIDLF